MPLSTRVLGVSAINFFCTTAAQSYSNHVLIHAQDHGHLQQRGTAPRTCACPSEGISTSVSGVSVITVAQNAPSGSVSTVFVTVSPSVAVSTVTRYISEGNTVPVDTVTITERRDAATGQPSTVTVTTTQLPPPGNNYHFITVTATQNGQATALPASTESVHQEPSQTSNYPNGSTENPIGMQTHNSSSSPPTTASLTVPGNYNYCVRQTCYNSQGDIVTTVAPKITDAPGCIVDAVSVVMETVYNTVTKTVYGLPTGGAGNSTGTSSGLENNSTVALVPRRAVVVDGLLRKLRRH